MEGQRDRKFLMLVLNIIYSNFRRKFIKVFQGGESKNIHKGVRRRNSDIENNSDCVGVVTYLKKGFACTKQLTTG